MTQKPISSTDEILSSNILNSNRASENNVKGLLHHLQQEFPIAISYFSKSIFLCPDEPSYYWHRAEAYLYSLEYDSAISNYMQFLKITNTSRYVCHFRLSCVFFAWGKILLDQKRYKQAIDAFDKAMELTCPKYQCILSKAIALTGLKYYEHALELLYQLIEMDSTDPQVYIFRAEIHKQLGNVDFVYLDTLRATELDPNHPNICELNYWISSIAVNFKIKATYEIRQGNLPQALALINQAISIDPQDWTQYIKRAQLLANDRKWADAIEDYLTVLNNNQRDTERDAQIYSEIAFIYAQIGLSFFKKHNISEAIRNFTISISYNPEQPHVLKNRADCFFLEEMYEKAVVDLRKSLSLKDEEDTRQKCAATYFALAKQSGNIHDLILGCSNAFSLDPKTSAYLFERANCYYILQDIANTRFDLEKCLELDPNHKHAMALLLSLDERTPTMKPFSAKSPKKATGTVSKLNHIHPDRYDTKSSYETKVFESEIYKVENLEHNLVSLPTPFLPALKQQEGGPTYKITNIERMMNQMRIESPKSRKMDKAIAVLHKKELKLDL